MRRWVRAVPLILLMSIAFGLGCGGLLYAASRLSGVTQYLLTGSLAGLVGGAVALWITRSASVAEVEVTIPQLSKVTFAVTKDHRVMARRIVNQLASRTAIQPLADGTGYANEAIQSLYDLFVFVRQLVDEDATARIFPGRPKVDVLALNMQNKHLRPFLSTWHRAYGDWRAINGGAPESAWPLEDRFRAELRALQEDLRPIAIAFATMAGFEGYTEVIGLGPAPTAAAA